MRVICYDVKSDKRRNQVFKLLKDYGQWVQYSVFELQCSDQEWIELEHRLAQLLIGEDSLCVYNMCKTCVKKIYHSKGLEEDLQAQQTNIL